MSEVHSFLASLLSYFFNLPDNGFCMIALKRITALKTLNKKDMPVYNKSTENHDDYVIPVPIVERW